MASFSRGAATWRSASMKKKLFLVFLGVSLLPTALMTVLSSVAIYDQVYQATITLNTEGLQWSQQQLRYYASEINGMFYALELDRDFKLAVERWDGGTDSLQDFGLVRERLISLLNRYSFMSSLELLIPGSNISILAERTGVRFRTDGDEAFRSSAVITRNQELQTNLFFKRIPSGVVAVHDMRRFEDQSLIAQIQAGIHLRPLESIMSRLLLLSQERIVIQNDEGEVIASLPVASGNEVSNLANGDHWVRFSSYAPRERLSISKAVPRREIARSILPAVYGGLFIGILSAIGAVAASALLSGIISKPVVRLAERVRNIELQTLVLGGEDERGDEVSLLEHHITLFVQRIRQLIRDEYDSKLQARLAQIDALQAQVNPHFLHNTLQLIGSVSLAGRSQEAYRITTALSSLMRYSMAFEDSLVTLDDELHNLEHYFTIQRERFTDRFSVDMHVDPQVRDCLVPKLLIQPLVENAFRHGFSGSSQRWQLGITAFQDESNKVHVVVRDNGAGIEEGLLRRLQDQIDQRNREGSLLGPLRLAEHIGLLNTNDRIRLAYAPGDGLTLRSKAGEFTEVSLCFEARRSS
jgi:two-component system sensor histidine kinase YesM